MVNRQVSVEFYTTTSCFNWKLLSKLQKWLLHWVDKCDHDREYFEMITHVHVVIDEVAIVVYPGEVVFIRNALTKKVLGEPFAVMTLPSLTDSDINSLLNDLLKMKAPSVLRAWAWLLSFGLLPKPRSCVSVCVKALNKFFWKINDPVWPHKLFTRLRKEKQYMSNSVKWRLQDELKQQ